MNRLMALIAFAFLAAFLGILILHVPSLDLVIITLAVVAMAAWDFVTSSGKSDRR